MVKLPVSGAEIALRKPDGADEMVLHETMGSPVEAGLALIARLARPVAAGQGGQTGGQTGDEADWAGLAVTDFEFLLLSARVARFGQRITLGFACLHCNSLADVSFRVADYLAGVTPRTVAGVTPLPARPGWFTLAGAGFRLPTGGDMAVAAGMAHPARGLAERCLDETARRPPHRARVERAMAAMAPELSRPISGQCPSCGAAVQAVFSVAKVVVAELKRAASGVHDEVDLIARAYHWPEATILALPQDRRRAYAQRIRRAYAQAA